MLAGLRWVGIRGGSGTAPLQPSSGQRTTAPTSPWQTEIPLELWFGTPTKPAKRPCLTHHGGWFAAWRQLQRACGKTCRSTACVRSGAKRHQSGTAFFQVEMRQPVYDGCAADRTQAVLLQGFGRSGDLRRTIESPTNPPWTTIPLELWFGTPTKPAKRPCLTHHGGWFAAWRQLQRACGKTCRSTACVRSGAKRQQIRHRVFPGRNAPAGLRRLRRRSHASGTPTRLRALRRLASDHSIANTSAPNFGMSFGSGSPGPLRNPSPAQSSGSSLPE